MSSVMPSIRRVSILTILDNDVFKEGLKSAWALSLYLEITYDNNRTYKMLVDVGGNLDEWIYNVKRLNLKFDDLGSIFITHLHGDHAGILPELLEELKEGIKVYVPERPWISRSKLRERKTELIICKKAREIEPQLFSTGALGYIKEHSLVINMKEKGLIIVVGCTHPGIYAVINKAKEITGNNKIYAVIGGFHLYTYDEGRRVGEYLKDIGVELVSPMHCTSDEAKRGILEVIGEERFIKNGSGRLCVFE